MKILMLSWEYPPRIVGGISRVVYDLAQKLAEKSVEVHVITLWEPGSMEFEKDNLVYVHRVHAYDIKDLNFVYWVMQLNYALIEKSINLISESGGFDIIHAHDWLVAFAAKTLKYSYKTILITTIHATEYGRNWGLHNELQRYISNVEKWIIQESDYVIVNSEYMKKELEDIFNIENKLDKQKLFVIPNGVYINKFDDVRRSEDFRSKFAKSNEKIIFFVGRIVNEKGVHVLIDAIPKILHNNNKIKFVIAGRGAQLDHLKWKVWNKNLSHYVNFTGYINDEDLLKLYKCVDVAVFPSLYEPFGIVCLEAMVAKIPVVASDTGGLSSIIDHEVNGMKSYVGNSNSLADNVIKILNDDELRDSITSRAYEVVKDKYNWEIITEKILELYHNATLIKNISE